MTTPIRRVRLSVIYWELFGFALVAALLWLDELLDFPHVLMGAPATPVNWRESVLESACITALAVIVTSMTYRALQRIRYLEDFMRVCSSCKRIFSGGVWISIDQYLNEQTEIRILHGRCPECESSGSAASF